MNNLGLPGNVETALATIDASQGLPLHLAHVQFYAYGTEGKNGFSSAAAQFAEKINANKNVTVDVGQVMFADIVTISSDVMKQFNSLPGGRPKKGVIFDGDSAMALGVRALCLSRFGLLQCGAMGGGARAVPADATIRCACSSPPTIRTARPSPPIRKCSRC